MKKSIIIINLFLCLLILTGCVSIIGKTEVDDKQEVSSVKVHSNISFKGKGIQLNIDSSAEEFCNDEHKIVIVSERNASTAKAEKEAQEELIKKQLEEQERLKREEAERIAKEAEIKAAEEVAKKEAEKEEESNIVNNVTSNNVNKEEVQEVISVKDVSYDRYATTSLNIRKGPSTLYEIIGSLSYNQKIHVNGECEDGWVRIDYNGNNGYVSSNYLSVNKIENKPVENTTSNEVNKETSNNVNKGNSITFNSITYRGFNISPDLGTCKVSDLDERLQGFANEIMEYVKYSDIYEIDLGYLGWTDYYEFNKVRTAINNTYFEYTWGLNISYSAIDGNEYRLYATESRKEYNENIAIKEMVIKAANNCVYSGMNEREAVVAINNYVCRYLTYDNNAIGLYQALKEGRAICGGYASMFNAICRYAGIECYEESGYASSGVPHAWNKVKIGNEWYYVDPTWNDSTNNEYLLSTTLWSDHIKK